jgi:hypothetical protein
VHHRQQEKSRPPPKRRLLHALPPQLPPSPSRPVAGADGNLNLGVGRGRSGRGGQRGGSGSSERAAAAAAVWRALDLAWRANGLTQWARLGACSASRANGGAGQKCVAQRAVDTGWQ